MQSSLSLDTLQRIDEHIASGQFGSQDEVVQAALAALERQEEDWKAISAGIADMEAGRVQTFAAVDTELRSKHDIAPDTRT